MTRADAIIEGLMGEADTLLLGLFRNALIGIYVVQRDRFIYVNRQLADLFGYTQEELCDGLGPQDLMAQGDSFSAQCEIGHRMADSANETFYGFRAARKDGSLFDVEVFGISASFAGERAVIGMLLDVSERTSAERAVADQLRFIGQLVNTIPNPVFYKDEKGRYLGCNTAFEEFVGIERDKLVGCSVYDISPKDLADKYFAADQALFDEPGKQIYEAAVAGADGARRDVMFYKATFNKADGTLGGLVGVILDISERKRMEQAIWREANYDALTGLPNRRLFRDRLGEELKRAQRNGSRLALLFIDLDRFKEVNDTLGHDVGDKLLATAAGRIRGTLRATDTVARQGGDEFIVILPDLAETAAAERVASDIIRALALPFDLGGHLAYVSASVGIAFFPDDGSDMEALLSYSDQAMYAAKERGRNCYCHFTPSMQTRALQRMEIGIDLRQAKIADEFLLHYQPIVDLASDRVVKAEALLRWNHPQRGLVGPSEFIPIAEEIGAIGEIGNWVFREAMATALRWRTLSPRAGTQPPIQVSVNISPQQFIAGMCGGWVEHLRRHDVPPHLLALEITEGLLLDERQGVVETLLAFRNAGVQISIDDFGTGYSAMSYLKTFDIDYLKIDRSFVHGLTNDPSDLAIAEAVIVMAHKLGIKVIAEGVETAAQRDLLRQAGCDYAQGHLYSKPLAAKEFEAYLGLRHPEAGRAAFRRGTNPGGGAV